MDKCKYVSGCRRLESRNQIGLVSDPWHAHSASHVCQVILILSALNPPPPIHLRRPSISRMFCFADLMCHARPAEARPHSGHRSGVPRRGHSRRIGIGQPGICGHAAGVDQFEFSRGGSSLDLDHSSQLHVFGGVGFRWVWRFNLIRDNESRQV